MGRAKFSLLTILLVVAIVGCAIRVVQLSRENKDLQTHITRLKSRAGDIDILDNKKIYLRPLECSGSLTWRFNAFIPHRKCRIRAVPINAGVAERTRANSCTLSSDGYYVMTLNIGQSGPGKIDYRVYVNSERHGMTTGGELKAAAKIDSLWWSHDPHSQFIGPLITRGQLHGDVAEHGTDEPILLARVVEDDDDPKSNGLEFWLDPTDSDDQW